MKSPKQKAMENVLHEIQEIIHLVESYKGETLNAPENLEIMQAEAEVFGMMIDSINEFSDGFQPQGAEQLLPKDDTQKQLLVKVKEMEQKGILLQNAFSEVLKGSKKPRRGKETSQMKKRRKLFKTIGGDKTWIPL